MIRNTNKLFYIILFLVIYSCSSIPKNMQDYKINRDFYPSLNQDERIRFLVFHYTVADNDRSIKILSGKTDKEVSSHYLVNDKNDKDIYLLVDESKRAWHAGLSNWGAVNNINFSSIGIEIVNKGFIMDNGVRKFESFPDHQIKKVAYLAKRIIERYQIKPENIIGHSDLTNGRKLDPGPKFPWKKLYYDYGIGAWYSYQDKKIFESKFNRDILNNKTFIKSVQKDFTKYGYKIDESGKWDKQTEDVIRVFQYHFRPDKNDGVLDSETWAILQSLIKKYKSPQLDTNQSVKTIVNKDSILKLGVPNHQNKMGANPR